MLSNKSNKELVEAGHQFAKALDADMPLTEIAKLISALSTRLDCAIVRGDELQQKLDAMAQSTQWKPEICPITRRPFFMWIEHPSDGMVPTYGGPLDSYTIPTLDSDGEFCCERFDHDEGCWVDSECVGVRLANTQEPEIDAAYLNLVRAEGVEMFASEKLELASSHMASGNKEMSLSNDYCAMSATEFAAQLRSGTHDTADKAG